MRTENSIWDEDSRFRRIMVAQDREFRTAMKTHYPGERYDRTRLTAPPVPKDTVTQLVGPIGHVFATNLRPFRWQEIVVEVAEKYQMTVPELLSHRRFKTITKARGELWSRLYKETTLSMPDIGRKTGGFDHTTVLNGIRKYGIRERERA